MTVVEYIRANPGATNAEVASVLGVTVGSVATIRWAEKNEFRRFCKLGELINERPHLRDWLHSQCPDGVPMVSFIVSILEDAYAEDTTKCDT